MGSRAPTDRYRIPTPPTPKMTNRQHHQRQEMILLLIGTDQAENIFPSVMVLYMGGFWGRWCWDSAGKGGRFRSVSGVLPKRRWEYFRGARRDIGRALLLRFYRSIFVQAMRQSLPKPDAPRLAPSERPVAGGYHNGAHRSSQSRRPLRSAPVLDSSRPRSPRSS